MYSISIIKPDAVRRNLSGKILSMIESMEGVTIVAQKMIRLTDSQAQSFYAVHKDRPFFAELCTTMSSGPVVVTLLKGDKVVSRYRELMGATDPKDADKGTIRANFAVSKGENSVHGSDSEANAEIERRFFFSDLEIV